jgi:hypothetical protein
MAIKMKYLLFPLFTLIGACQQKEHCCTNIDIGVDIFLKNKAGQNLFLPATPNAIDPNAIRLIYLVGGQEESFYAGHLDCPTNVCFVADMGMEHVVIFPNDIENEPYPETFIKWTDADMDTMRCHFIRKNQGSFLVCDSVWFNETLMFPDSALSEFGRAFNVFK